MSFLKAKVLFYPMLPDLQKGIAFWNVPKLRRLSFFKGNM
jgi:hypothetical protein